MEQKHCNTEKKQYKHLKEKDRYKIEAWLKDKRSIPSIARDLGKHISTIYREIHRGSILLLQSDLSKKVKYKADISQIRYNNKAKNKGRMLKIGKDKKLEAHIKERIIDKKYSPDVTIGEIKAKGLKFEGMICTKTLYNYIDAGVFNELTNENLWEKRKREKRNYKRVRRVSLKNTLSRSIDERPSNVEQRKEYGHWEGDCVKGKSGSKASLFTLTERKTREEIIIKLEQATQANIIKSMDQLEDQYDNFKIKFKSITFDNGSEFLDWEKIERSSLEINNKRTKTYFAHPYSSWERGTNENHNRMIRRFIPKGTNLEKISCEKLKEIEEWMNNYPRKILGYKTPNELVKECMQNNS